MSKRSADSARGNHAQIATVKETQAIKHHSLIEPQLPTTKSQHDNLAGDENLNIPKNCQNLLKLKLKLFNEGLSSNDNYNYHSPL